MSLCHVREHIPRFWEITLTQLGRGYYSTTTEFINFIKLSKIKAYGFVIFLYFISLLFVLIILLFILLLPLGFKFSFFLFRILRWRLSLLIF